MAYEIPGFAYTLESHGDITQFTAVKVRSDGKVEEASANENPIAGVAQMPADSDLNEPIRIMQTGVSFAVGDSSFNAGETVAVASDGKFTDSSNHVVGIALTACGGDDELFALLLTSTGDKG